MSYYFTVRAPHKAHCLTCVYDCLCCRVVDSIELTHSNIIVCTHEPELQRVTQRATHSIGTMEMNSRVLSSSSSHLPLCAMRTNAIVSLYTNTIHGWCGVCTCVVFFLASLPCRFVFRQTEQRPLNTRNQRTDATPCVVVNIFFLSLCACVCCFDICNDEIAVCMCALHVLTYFYTRRTCADSRSRVMCRFYGRTFETNVCFVRAY